MAVPYENFVFRTRQNTDAALQDYVLKTGELAFATDTKKFAIGDGVTPWQSLANIAAPGSSLTTPVTILGQSVASLADLAGALAAHLAGEAVAGGHDAGNIGYTSPGADFVGVDDVNGALDTIISLLPTAPQLAALSSSLSTSQNGGVNIQPGGVKTYTGETWLQALIDAASPTAPAPLPASTLAVISSSPSFKVTHLSCALDELSTDPADTSGGATGKMFSYPANTFDSAKTIIVFPVRPAVGGISAGQGLAVTAVANNGAGLYRVTLEAAHGLADNAYVTISAALGQTALNGRKQITTVAGQPNQFDIVGSTYTAGYTGSARVVLAEFFPRDYGLNCRLNATSGVFFYRGTGVQPALRGIKMNATAQVLQYVGPAGGRHEVLMRHTLNRSILGTADTDSRDITVNGIVNPDKTVVFLAGFDGGLDLCQGAACYLYRSGGIDTLVLRRSKPPAGTAVDASIFYRTFAAEFTGKWWKIHHFRGLCPDSADTGTLSLYSTAGGPNTSDFGLNGATFAAASVTGTPSAVVDWSKSLIIGHFAGVDETTLTTDQNACDVWPVFTPPTNGDKDKVAWRFNAARAIAAGKNQFINGYVIEWVGPSSHPYPMQVIRFNNADGTHGSIPVDISDAGAKYFGGRTNMLVVGFEDSSDADHPAGAVTLGIDHVNQLTRYGQQRLNVADQYQVVILPRE